MPLLPRLRLEQARQSSLERFAPSFELGHVGNDTSFFSTDGTQRGRGGKSNGAGMCGHLSCDAVLVFVGVVGVDGYTL